MSPNIFITVVFAYSAMCQPYVGSSKSVGVQKAQKVLLEVLSRSKNVVFRSSDHTWTWGDCGGLVPQAKKFNVWGDWSLPNRDLIACRYRELVPPKVAHAHVCF